VLGVDSPAGAADATKKLGGRVLVARQIAAGPEVLCGVARDPLYGPLVAVGLGGAAVEALSLTAVALAPLDREAALELVDEAPALPAVAHEALADILVALSRLAIDHPEIAEVDLNPVILRPDGATPVDALVVVE
jgi:acetyltransferase